MQPAFCLAHTMDDAGVSHPAHTHAHGSIHSSVPAQSRQSSSHHMVPRGLIIFIRVLYLWALTNGCLDTKRTCQWFSQTR